MTATYLGRVTITNNSPSQIIVTMAQRGIKGDAAALIELQNDGTYIQWRLVGDAEWINLVPLTAITGPQGPATSLALGTITGETVQVTSDTGADVTLPARTDTAAGLMTAADVATLATALQPGDIEGLGGGTVTSVAASGSGGIAVSGSPITGAGTLALSIPAGTFAAASHNQAWSTITDTPTTLAGYGITDGGGSSVTVDAAPVNGNTTHAIASDWAYDHAAAIDTATTDPHHTIGTGANQAAAGNHSHGAASTSAAGFSPQATAPASGSISAHAIAHGETARTDKVIFSGFSSEVAMTESEYAALGTPVAGILYTVFPD